MKTKIMASGKVAGQLCCQYGTTLCSNPVYFTRYSFKAFCCSWRYGPWALHIWCIN